MGLDVWVEERKKARDTTGQLVYYLFDSRIILHMAYQQPPRTVKLITVNPRATMRNIS